MEPMAIIVQANKEYEVLLTMINQHHAAAVKIEETIGRDAALSWYQRTAGMVDAFDTIYGDCRGEAKLEYDFIRREYYAVPKI